MEDTFEKLIQTIERGSKDNVTLITNVEQFAKSWRLERKIDNEAVCDHTPQMGKTAHVSPLIIKTFEKLNKRSMANTKWEYKKWHSEIPVSSAILNTYGQEGWQLCHDHLNEHGVYYYTFKRPIIDCHT